VCVCVCVRVYMSLVTTNKQLCVCTVHQTNNCTSYIYAYVRYTHIIFELNKNINMYVWCVCIPSVPYSKHHYNSSP